MDRLNYHHLRLFHRVAHEGNLTRAARSANISQSALSSQIRTLEGRLGHDLFARVGRRLELTEVGTMVLDHADRIFGTGQELLASLSGVGEANAPLRVGALSTLSRNFQIGFLKPVLSSASVEVMLRSGTAGDLLKALSSLALDVVLTTEPPARNGNDDFTSRLIDRQSVGIHGAAHRLRHASLAQLLSEEPLIVPTDDAFRRGFETLVAELGITPRIAAGADDMAMVRLLTRADVGVALVPAIVLADELASGLLETAPFDLNIEENFFAITAQRTFPHPALGLLFDDE